VKMARLGDDKEVTNKGDTESNDTDKETTSGTITSQTKDRGEGRPTVLKTRMPGRPRKVYQPKVTSCPDPKSAFSQKF